MHTTMAVYPTPLGPLEATWASTVLVGLRFVPAQTPPSLPPDTWAEQLGRELEHYFAHPSTHRWQIAWRLSGTVFQQRVWQALMAIPAGQTRRYGELAQTLASSARAVGGACRANPLPLLVPCHRVVARQGLGGYDGQVAGVELERKSWLLRHEGALIHF